MLSVELNDGDIEIHRRIVDLHKAGESLKSISRKVGISISAIRHCIEKHNLDVKFEEKDIHSHVLSLGTKIVKVSSSDKTGNSGPRR